MNKGYVFRTFLAIALIGVTVTAGVRQAYLARPREVSGAVDTGRGARTLILDPGHGGADGGAVSVTGTYESRLNLDIAVKCRDLAGLFGIPAVMTRESEQLDYPEDTSTIHAKKVWDTKRRTELINSTENAVLISIHQNKYTTAKPHGSQALYAPTEGSAELAQNMQTELAQVTGESKRTAAQIGESIYIMNHVNCLAVLVECGFVSNAVEAKMLEDPKYQLKLATIITGVYIRDIS